MLRDTGHSQQPGLCGENSVKETDGEVKPEGKNGSGDINTPIAATQACSRVPQLLRGFPQHLYCTGALQETG